MQIRKDATPTAASTSNVEEDDEISIASVDENALVLSNTASDEVALNGNTPKMAKVEVSKSGSLSYFTTMFDGIIRKRKHLADAASDSKTTGTSIMKNRTIKPLPSRTPTMKSWEDMFQSGINYTFMDFSQLESIKNDGIVPEAKILSAYWLQTKLLTQKPESIPPLRFSRTFSGMSAYFERNGDEPMYSDPITCCGCQYRLLLSKEGSSLKALLQKSRESGPITISYELYAVDHRTRLTKKQLLDLLVPVTSCEVDNSGHAFAIPLQPVKKEETALFLDELCLIATIQFQ
jgi:hypothetical protein